MRVFLDVPPFFIRPRNTDWRYVRFSLPKLNRFCPNIQPILPANKWYGWNESARHLFRAGLRRLHIQHIIPNRLDARISERSVYKSGADLLFSHNRFPSNISSVPVVWQNTILDPEMQQSRGIPTNAIEEEYKNKKLFFEKCAAIQVITEAEARRLAARMPEIASRFWAVPFFLPDLNALDSAEIVAKQCVRNVNLLFVGNEAHRKGLDLLLQAFSLLTPNIQGRTQLHVVSSMADGKINLPNGNNLVFHGALSHQAVMKLMQQAHILIMPSRFESYGIVFIEAMSCGVVSIGPAWEPQREILADGEVGIPTNGSLENIANALENLIGDSRLRTQMALAARNKFESQYSPRVVAAKYFQMFQAAIATS